MKKAKTNKRPGPTVASLVELPEVDFRQYGPAQRNPFAARAGAEGWELVHEEPSGASLREIPETDFARVRPRPNPYAKRIKAEGYDLQVGRRRPEAGTEIGPTVVKSVRLPPALWERLEARARAEGVALHALVRSALAALLDEKPPRKKRTG